MGRAVQLGRMLEILRWTAPARVHPLSSIIIVAVVIVVTIIIVALAIIIVTIDVIFNITPIIIGSTATDTIGDQNSPMKRFWRD